MTVRAPLAQETRRRGERGVSLAEVVVVLFLLALTLLVTTPISLRWLNAEGSKSAVYQTQTLMQLARAEAVARNRPCRFEINTIERRVVVLDLNDPGNPADDLPIANVLLPSQVAFTSPSGDPAVTLEDLGGLRFGAVFEPDGVISAGTGYVVLDGNDSFNRLSLYAGGGTKVERWASGSWQAGP